MLQLSAHQLSALRESLDARLYLTNALDLPPRVFLDVDDNYILFALVDARGNILVGRVAILKDASVDEQLALIGAD